MSLNLASIPLKAASRYPDAPALLTGDTTITYESLKAQIRYCAALLQHNGISKGDNVVLLLPNVPHFTINYFALHYLGAVAVPLNVLFVAEELKYHFNDCDARAVIAWETLLDNVLPAAKETGCEHVFVCRPPGSRGDLPDGVIDQEKALEQLIKTGEGVPPDQVVTQADDTAVILYTSGTTGRAKGAELTHFNIYDNARFVAECLQRTQEDVWPVFTRGDVALAALPLFHSFGQTVIQNAFLIHGACVSLLPRFTPQAAAAQFAAHKVTFFAGVPGMYIALLNDPAVTVDHLQSLKCAVSGGAALPVEVLKQFRERFGIEIQEGYGLSETSPVACFNMLHRGCRPGTVGPAIDLCDVKIVDDGGNDVPAGERGEVVIKGSNVMKGYYKRSADTADVLRNGWFHSGDIGTRDGDGYISIVDRKKEMIIRGGFNVYPREIEEVLYKHPDISEAAVIGAPSEMHGEEVVAIIALKDGASLDHDSLEAFCRQHLAAYKVPRKSVVVDGLPKGPTGKILKRVLKDKYSAG
ncbi:MAG: long-chain fatty acid--CoA ligase [Gammaproteobacteria bacterium]